MYFDFEIKIWVINYQQNFKKKKKQILFDFNLTTKYKIVNKICGCKISFLF